MRSMHATILGTALMMGGLSTGAASAGPQEKTVAAKGSEVTVIGCVIFEKDYRKLHNDGKGGVLGTGIGEANEFVLIDAVSSPKDLDKSPVRTAANKTTTYALTGKLEKNFRENVNRQVEVVGTLRPGKAGAGKDANPGELPKIDVTLSHTVADYCPAEKK